jgi:hypothetical protein
MIHASEDCEGLERVQLDDYDDYLLDPLDEDVNVTMDSEFPNNIKVENAYDIQKEHRNDTVGDRQPLQFLHGRPPHYHQRWPGALNVIIARQQEREEVEAYSPTHYQLPLDYLETTWKRKPESGKQSTHRKKTLNSKERFEEALHGRCPWHPKSKHSVFEYQTLRMVLGAPPKLRRKATGLPE